MARGIQYRGAFTSQMRRKRSYEVTISADGYSGSQIEPLKFTGDYVTLTFGERDQNELHPIKSSQAEISILCEEAGHPYAKLYTTKSNKYLVNIVELGDTGASVLWRGYLTTSPYSQPLGNKPYVIRLIANDGFAILKEKPYLDNSREKFIDSISVSDLLNRLIEPLEFGIPIDLGPFPRYSQAQQGHTLEDISIPSQSIYDVFSEVPSYYDVLEAVLSNFALQMYQYKGRWVVRRLIALAESVTSNILPVITLDGVENGLGVSSSAVLSINPPIKEISVQKKDIGGFRATSIRNTAAWQIGRVNSVPTTMPYIRPYGDLLRVYPGQSNTSTLVAASICVLPGILKASPNSRINISLDVYNFESEASSVYIDVWLVDSTIADEVLRFDEECNLNGQAIKIKGNSLLQLPKLLSSAVYAQYGNLVTIGSSSIQGVKPQPSQLTKESLSFEIPQIPEVTTTTFGRTTSWQIALVIAPYGTRAKRLLMSVPEITVENTSNMGEDVSVVQVSSSGVDSLSAALKWRTASNAIDVFRASLISLARRTQVRGYFNAGQGGRDFDMIASMISNLRSKPTQVIEGEVDTRELSLSSVVQYDNRHYYLNYVKHLLKRDIFDVQMCELPILDNIRKVSRLSVINPIPASQPIALSNSVYYIVNDTLYRYDCEEDSIHNIREAADSYICLGVDCVTFIKETGAAICEAYNDSGELIAELTYIGDGGISVSQWAATARYDAYNNIWLVTDGDKTAILYDDAGYELKRYVSSYNRTPINTHVLPYRSGFVLKYVDQAVTGTVGWRSEIVVYDLHDSPQSRWTPYQAEVLSINDFGYVYRMLSNNNLYLVCHDDNDFVNGTSNSIALVTKSEFIGMNSALIAVNTSIGVRVYDRRSSRSASRLTTNSGTLPTLCGDRVISFSVTANIFTFYADIVKIIAQY